MTRKSVIAVYVSAATFITAHTINALVADALLVPLETGVTTVTSAGAENVVTSTPQDVQKILHSGLFQVPQTSDVVGSSTSGRAPVSSLDAAKKVALLGTVLGKGGGVMAALEDISTKKQDLYNLGSLVPNVGTLAEIEKDRVLFREGTAEEWLELPIALQVSSGPPAPPSSSPTSHMSKAPQGPQRKVVDRREVEAALSDTTRLLTQAQAMPHLKEGKLDGFLLYNVGGFFTRIGLQSNDLLQRVNGVEIKDPGMVLALFQQLRNENTIKLDLVRHDQPQTITYDIR